MTPWTLLEHPADLAIEGQGTTPAGALAGVVDGLLAQLDLGVPTTGDSEDITVEGLDWEECVVGALNELLYRINLQQRRLACPKVLVWEETRICLRLASDRRPATVPLATEIKAATYHGLRLVFTSEGSWRLQVVFDV